MNMATREPVKIGNQLNTLSFNWLICVWPCLFWRLLLLGIHHFNIHQYLSRSIDIIKNVYKNRSTLSNCSGVVQAHFFLHFISRHKAYGAAFFFHWNVCFLSNIIVSLQFIADILFCFYRASSSIGINYFSSLMFWWIIMSDYHHHRHRLFRCEMTFYVCAVWCLHRNGAFYLKFYRRRLDNGFTVNPLQQKECVE